MPSRAVVAEVRFKHKPAMVEADRSAFDFIRACESSVPYHGFCRAKGDGHFTRDPNTIVRGAPSTNLACPLFT